MKKILLITTLAASALTANAGMNMNFETGHPYIKAHVGAVKGQNMHVYSDDYRSKTSVIGSVAMGYNLTDMTRFDVALDYIPNIKTYTKDNEERADNKFRTGSVFLNYYGDIAECNGFGVFVGAGAGLSYHKMKTVYRDLPSNTITNRTKQNIKGKFSYALYAGTSYEVATGTHAELMFAYKNLGRINHYIDATNTSPNDLPLSIKSAYIKTYNLTAGVRFDI